MEIPILQSVYHFICHLAARMIDETAPIEAAKVNTVFGEGSQ
jgi:hypothetical protein